MSKTLQYIVSRLISWYLRALNSGFWVNAKRRAIYHYVSARALKLGESVAFRDLPIFYNLHQLSIGNDVNIGDCCHFNARSPIFIGNRVLIANNVQLLTATHDHCSSSMHLSLNSAPIHIGDDCWLGANSIVMPGITIGRGAVIGAGSIVTRNVKEYSIVAGAPAQLIKMRTIKT